jgi:type I restriction enzyme M protein
VFTETDTISLDPASVAYVVGELQNYCIVEADRDAVGDAFEVFISPALRGGEGQFFTPRNAVRMVIEMIDPSPGEMVIDPACGSGGFLVAALEYVWKKVESEGVHKGWSAVQVDRKKRDVASRFFRGLDKDAFLAKVTKAYMAIIGDGRGGVFCENSLLPPSEWLHPGAQGAIQMGKFDVVLTNPPFGSKIPIKGAPTLAQYALGHKWSRPRASGPPTKTGVVREDQSPHILFLERCLQLLKPGGRLGIVLPESILGNPSYAYVMQYLAEQTTIRAIVTMPEALFKTSGKGGTHTKTAVIVLEKSKMPQDHKVFMSTVKWCGHDSRGNPTLRKRPDGTVELLDEVPQVPALYRAAVTGDHGRSHLGFMLAVDDIRNGILVPKYYDPELEAAIEGLSVTHDMVALGDYVARGIVSIQTGTEIGKMAYGTGTIPFVRTSDFSNLEIKSDFKHGVSEAIYEKEKSKAEVRAGDILMVRDGTYLIGSTAIVSESDLPMLYQSHIYRIRVERPAELSPWLLLACLNTTIVKRQVRANQFTQDIIDTLGRRILEVRVPIPRDATDRLRIAAETQEVIETRVRLRNRVKEIAREVEGGVDMPDDLTEFALDEV